MCATLPGGDQARECRHDPLLQLLLALGRRAGLPIADEVRSLFAHLLDHDEQVQGQRQGLRPDLVVTMRAAMRTGGREALRQVLMDVKTVYAGGGAYARARTSRRRSRAVEVREAEVPEEVRRQAREADWAMARRVALAAANAVARVASLGRASVAL